MTRCLKERMQHLVTHEIAEPLRLPREHDPIGDSIPAAIHERAVGEGNRLSARHTEPGDPGEVALEARACFRQRPPLPVDRGRRERLRVRWQARSDGGLTRCE
jgi:hypothetical protein